MHNFINFVCSQTIKVIRKSFSRFLITDQHICLPYLSYYTRSELHCNVASLITFFLTNRNVSWCLHGIRLLSCKLYYKFIEYSKRSKFNNKLSIIYCKRMSVCSIRQICMSRLECDDETELINIINNVIK